MQLRFGDQPAGLLAPGGQRLAQGAGFLRVLAGLEGVAVAGRCAAAPIGAGMAVFRGRCFRVFEGGEFPQERRDARGRIGLGAVILRWGRFGAGARCQIAHAGHNRND
jgi:hypothetical protein